jgi:hypothetical protein
MYKFDFYLINYVYIFYFKSYIDKFVHITRRHGTTYVHKSPLGKKLCIKLMYISASVLQSYIHKFVHITRRHGTTYVHKSSLGKKLCIKLMYISASLLQSYIHKFCFSCISYIYIFLFQKL